jgi:hypothetical protein
MGFPSAELKKDFVKCDRYFRTYEKMRVEILGICLPNKSG